MTFIKVAQERATGRWLVACGLCKPGLFGNGEVLIPSWQAIAVAPELSWTVALAFAIEHAAEHAAHQCPTCGHQPAGAIPLPEQWEPTGGKAS